MTDDPTDNDLRAVADLAHVQREHEANIAHLEAVLKEAKNALNYVSETLLPDAMRACGLKEYRTTDGLSVRVDEKFRCGQLDDSPDEEGKRPRSERLEALSWLEDHGHGDIAKRVVTVTLGAGSLEAAVELIRLIRTSPGGNQLLIDHRRLVPWGSLSKFARTQVRDQRDPPLDVLGVARVSVARVKRETD